MLPLSPGLRDYEPEVGYPTARGTLPIGRDRPSTRHQALRVPTVGPIEGGGSWFDANNRGTLSRTDLNKLNFSGM